MTSACRDVAAVHAVSASSTTVARARLRIELGLLREVADREARAARSTVPPSGVSTPARIFASVDLPAPLAPMRPTFSPRASVKRRVVEDDLRAERLAQVLSGESGHVKPARFYAPGAFRQGQAHGSLAGAALSRGQRPSPPRGAAPSPAGAASPPRGAALLRRQAASPPRGAASPPRGAALLRRQAASPPRGAALSDRQRPSPPRETAPPGLEIPRPCEKSYADPKKVSLKTTSARHYLMSPTKRRIPRRRRGLMTRHSFNRETPR